MKLISTSLEENVILTQYSENLDTSVVLDKLWFSVNGGVTTIDTIEYGIDGKSVVLTCEEPSSIEDYDYAYLTYSPQDLSTSIRPVHDEEPLSESDARILALKPFSGVRVERTVKDSSNLRHNYPISLEEKPSDKIPAEVGDFILAYGKHEALQLSNLDSGRNEDINYLRIQRAIEDALSYIDNYISQATAAGKRLISSNRRRTSLIIARYYLDSVRRRQDVTDDYERAIKELENSSVATGVVSDKEEDLPVGSKGIIKSFLTPQVYNRQSGKGLCGWEIFSKGNSTRKRPNGNL